MYKGFAKMQGDNALLLPQLSYGIAMALFSCMLQAWIAQCQDVVETTDTKWCTITLTA